VANDPRYLSALASIMNNGDLPEGVTATTTTVTYTAIPLWFTELPASFREPFQSVLQGLPQLTVGANGNWIPVRTDAPRPTNEASTVKTLLPRLTEGTSTTQIEAARPTNGFNNSGGTITAGASKTEITSFAGVGVLVVVGAVGIL